MDKRDDGGPAFPVPIIVLSGSDSHQAANEFARAVRERPMGLSLRDWFAGQVLPVIWPDTDTPQEAAEGAYMAADAMLAERAKEQKT